jgi:quercetin dioxygenase-like cupin family protein
MVIRAHERPFYESTWSQSTIQMLTDSNPQRKLSAIMIIIQLQGTSSNRPTIIPHDAIAFIPTGELTMTVDDESVDLHTGDTIYLRHDAAIAWQNTHDQPTSMLMVSIAEYTEILADTFQE